MMGSGAMGGSDGKRRTGLVLAAVALVFFVGIMIKTWLVGR
jgi:hypothetical protein